MKNKTNSKTWKESLLQSGLPLELEAASTLSTLGFKCLGQFQYSRLNEENVLTEFSVDLCATAGIRYKQISGSLAILAECKYCNPSKIWCFVPATMRPDSSIGSNLVPCITTLDDLISYRALKTFSGVHRQIEKWQAQFSICVSGTEIHRTGEKDDPHPIQRGFNQLRFALPIAYFSLADIQTKDKEPKFILPLLITTAELWVLKENLSVSKVKMADGLESVARQVDALLMYSLSNLDFTSHLKSIRDGLEKTHPDLAKRLSQKEHKVVPSVDALGAITFNQDFGSFGLKIMVVTNTKLANIVESAWKVLIPPIRK